LQIRVTLVAFNLEHRQGTISCETGNHETRKGAADWLTLVCRRAEHREAKGLQMGLAVSLTQMAQEVSERRRWKHRESLGRNERSFSDQVAQGRIDGSPSPFTLTHPNARVGAIQIARPSRRINYRDYARGFGQLCFNPACELRDRLSPRSRSDIAQVDARQANFPVPLNQCDIKEILADVYPGDRSIVWEVAAAGGDA
jgi:hypothetical protein